MDKSLMDKRRNSQEYVDGVKQFLNSSGYGLVLLCYSLVTLLLNKLIVVGLLYFRMVMMRMTIF